MKKLRILLLGYIYGRGGIQTHTNWLARGLVERGHDVTVVTPSRMRDEIESLPVAAPYEIIEYRRASDIFGSFKSRKQFDVAVISGTGWRAMAGALCLSQCTKVFFEVMSGKRGKLLDPRYMVHLGFGAVVGQSSHVEHAFRTSFQWSKESVTIPALPEPLERAAEIPVRVSVSPSSRKIKCAYFGRLDPHKGVSYLVENWSSLLNAEGTLDIFGSGPEYDGLKRTIGQRNLGDQIQLMGPYPSGSEYVSLMQNYDLKLLPTVGDEGAPLVLLEAMAAGLPFVANGVGGIPQYANEDCEITSGDIAEFALHVQRLVSKLRAGTINHSRLQDFYVENFSHRVLTDRWEAFLTKITHTSGEKNS
jgi:glycosyltransferase involved in cell wall biosynthesis